MGDTPPPPKNCSILVESGKQELSRVNSLSMFYNYFTLLFVVIYLINRHHVSEWNNIPSLLNQLDTEHVCVAPPHVVQRYVTFAASEWWEDTEIASD